MVFLLLQILPVKFCIPFSVLIRDIFTYFIHVSVFIHFPLVHTASSGHLSPVIFNSRSPLSVRDGRIYGPSSYYKPISTTPTRRSRWNHLSNLSAAKLVAKWMTLHFDDKCATDITKSPQVNGIILKNMYKLILNTSHGKDSCTCTGLYLLPSTGCGVYQPAPYSICNGPPPTRKVGARGGAVG